MTEGNDRIDEPQRRRFPPYPKYRDSSVEWLGEIPAHWDVRRLRFVVGTSISKKEVSHLAPETEVSFVPMEAVHEYGGIDLDSRKSLSEVVEGYTYFRNGDVIVAKITPCFENGKGALATDLCSAVGFGTTELHVLRPSSHVAPRFLLYLTFSDHFRRIGAASMYGAGGQKRISDEFIRNFRHPVPSLPEQRVIADFLDRETAKIDGLVARKERLIELLQEKRTALITRAVTRGLDPKVPMKDSGIEWLGETPTHWELKPLKRLLRRSDYGISESLRVGGDIRVLTMAHIQDGEIVLPQDGSISGIDRTMVLESGDLLFNRTNSRELVGKVGIFRGDHDDWVTFASYLVRLTPHQHVEPEWLNYLLNSTGVLGMARSMALLSVNQANLNPTKHQQIIVPVPALSEQRSIAAFLSRETAKIDSLIVKIRQAINYLHEFRTAIISSAVTGKIDSREEAS